MLASVKGKKTLPSLERDRLWEVYLQCVKIIQNKYYEVGPRRFSSAIAHMDSMLNGEKQTHKPLYGRDDVLKLLKLRHREKRRECCLSCGAGNFTPDGMTENVQGSSVDFELKSNQIGVFATDSMYKGDRRNVLCGPISMGRACPYCHHR